MNSVWKTLIALSFLSAAAYGLKCRQCYVGVLGTCFFGNDVTCNNGTESCYRGEANFNATSSLTLHNRGCLDSDLCGKTLTGSLLGAAYTSSFSCCTTDLCNGAPAPQLALSAGALLPVLVSLCSL